MAHRALDGWLDVWSIDLRGGIGVGGCDNGSVSPQRYPLRMSPVARWVRVALLAVVGLVFIPLVLATGIEWWMRLLSFVGLVTSVLGIRTLLGAVLVVREEGLRIQKNWPRRRDILWYRILATDVIPGFWNLEIELNSGERVELPPVENLTGLYEEIERHRTALDA